MFDVGLVSSDGMALHRPNKKLGEFREWPSQEFHLQLSISVETM
jgi:hypothetical protein